MMNLDCAVDGFRAKIPVLKPELFLPQNLREIVVTDDEAVIKYTLPEPVDIELFMDYYNAFPLCSFGLYVLRAKLLCIRKARL